MPSTRQRSPSALLLRELRPDVGAYGALRTPGGGVAVADDGCHLDDRQAQLDPVAVALIAGTDQADVDRGVAGQYC